jgi:hypothetical protein
MKFVLVALILTLVIGLFFQGCVFAQEKAKAQDKIIGSMFKGLAKAYVAVTDLDKLKKNNIEELNQMDMESFKYRYANIYEVIRDWPLALKSSYKVAEQMTKEQAIKNIEAIDKGKIYEMIDVTSDAAIVAKFKKYLNVEGQEMQKNSLPEKINKVWNKILGKLNKPTPKNEE